jgi:methyl-accepting chemotaxis protein
MRHLRVQLTVLLALLVQQVAAEYRAWVRTGQTELKARERGARAAAGVVASGNADRHFRKLWTRQAALEEQLARSQRAYASSQDRTHEAAQVLAVRTALMMLAALVLLAVWLRRAVGAPADALRSASGRLAGGDLETPVALGVENELGAVASDLETMRRRLAGRMEALASRRPCSGWPATRSPGPWRRPCGWRRRSGRPARPGRCSTPSPTGCCCRTRSGGSRP